MFCVIEQLYYICLIWLVWNMLLLTHYGHKREDFYCSFSRSLFNRGDSYWCARSIQDFQGAARGLCIKGEFYLYIACIGVLISLRVVNSFVLFCSI